jgi:hypothetical protein
MTGVPSPPVFYTIPLCQHDTVAGRVVKPESVKKVLLIKSEKSEITVLPQPVRLGREVPVDNIALVILEAPGSDDQDIPFPDPDPLFDLALDPAHPGNPVIASHPDMICPHHEICKSKLFICPFFG